MSTTFHNAPLVEIIAELRWQSPLLPVKRANDKSSPMQHLAIDAFDEQTEAFFHRCTVEVTKQGFTQFEKLTPSGMPVFLWQQMAYRYRREDGLPVLAQVGPGIFSVNALPPYKSWAEFRPHLESGVDALLGVIANRAPELAVNLRYIDAFDMTLTDDRKANAFASEVLGFRVDLPETFQSRLTDGLQAKVAFQVDVPVPEMRIIISLSDGVLNDEPVVLMNTDVRVDGVFPPDKARLLSALDQAHKLAHETFVDMTVSMKDRLQPVAAEEKGG